MVTDGMFRDAVITNDVELHRELSQNVRQMLRGRVRPNNHAEGNRGVAPYPRAQSPKDGRGRAMSRVIAKRAIGGWLLTAAGGYGYGTYM